MKKLIFFFAATILSLTSCSKDDDNDNGGSNGGGTKLPKSVVTTTEPGNSISITDYTYDGTKISTASTSNTSKAVYSYTSDILSKIEYKTNEITTSYTDYTFENGDVKSTTNYSVNADKVATKTSSTAYTYDAASKTQTMIVTDYPNGVPRVSNETTVNTYDNNNLVKSVNTIIYDDKNDVVTTTEYTYDSKTNYFINVTGQPATIVKGKNNPTTVNTKVVYREDNVSSTPTTTQVTYEYTYDGSFPTNIKNFAGGTLRNTIKVFYN